MAVDLLAQRPRRSRPDPARDAAPRVARAGQGARPPGSRARQRRPARDRLGPRERELARVDEPADRRRAGRRRAPRGGVRRLRAPCAAPMLPMRFFRDRAFSAANGASLFMYFGMFGSIFLLTQFFQTAQGYSPLEPGFAFSRGRRCRSSSPRSPGRCPTGSAVGRSWRPGSRCRRSGSRGSPPSEPTLGYTSLVGPFVLSGIGMGMFFAPVANVVLSAVRRDEEGKASGVNNAIREVGGVFGVAVLASLFTHYGGYESPATFTDGLVSDLGRGGGRGRGSLVALVIPRKRGTDATSLERDELASRGRLTLRQRGHAGGRGGERARTAVSISRPHARRITRGSEPTGRECDEREAPHVPSGDSRRDSLTGPRCDARVLCRAFRVAVFGWRVPRLHVRGSRCRGCASDRNRAAARGFRRRSVLRRRRGCRRDAGSAEQLGGKTIQPAQQVPGVTFGVFADAQGHVVGVAAAD